MSSIDKCAEVLATLRASFDAGRMAHAYIVVGAPRTEGTFLAEALLSFLCCGAEPKPCGTCPACRRVRRHAHPDMHWIEPESKSRVIKVEQIRSLNARIARTSYEGGWKAGVLLHADRMNPQSGNAFLKTLEEPPPRTLFLLLTDAPQFLLPTILSRCQRVVLSNKPSDAALPWRGEVLDVLAARPTADVLDVLVRSSRLRAVLDKARRAVEKEEDEAPGAVEDEDEKIRDARINARVLEVRAEILRLLMLWRRDVLLCRLGVNDNALHFPEYAEALRRQAEVFSVPQALDQASAVDGMARRLGRNLPVPAVFDLDQLAAMKTANRPDRGGG